MGVNQTSQGHLTRGQRLAASHKGAQIAVLARMADRNEA
jgi:hypothetical protein